MLVWFGSGIMSNWPIGTYLRPYLPGTMTAKDDLYCVTGAPDAGGLQANYYTWTAGVLAGQGGWYRGGNYNFTNGSHDWKPELLPAGIKPCPHVSATPSPPRPLPFPPVAPVSVQPNEWKAGDMFRYPGERCVMQLLSDPDIGGVLFKSRAVCDEFDPVVGVWVGPRRAEWYFPDTSMVRYSGTPIPDSPRLKRTGVGYTFIGKAAPTPKLSDIGLNAALARSLGADLKKKPDNMPNNCGKCGNVMSASLDCYYGMDGVQVLCGSILLPAAWVCAKCRPRGV